MAKRCQYLYNCQMRRLTCDFDLVPQLRLVPFHLRLPFSIRGLMKLAGMHKALALETRKTLPVIIWQTGRHRAQIGPGSLPGIQPCQSLCPLLLQLLRELLDRQCLDDILGGGG